MFGGSNYLTFYTNFQISYNILVPLCIISDNCVIIIT